MFSKLIPSSVVAGSGPRLGRTEVDLSKAEIAARPPTFRTARHEVQPPHDPKAPPRVRSGAEHTLVAPGSRIEAADRTYTVGRSGELHREVTNRGRRQRKPSRAEQRARDRQAERIEAELARREGKRARGRLARRGGTSWNPDDRVEVPADVQAAIASGAWIKAQIPSTPAGAPLGPPRYKLTAAKEGGA